MTASLVFCAGSTVAQRSAVISPTSFTSLATSSTLPFSVSRVASSSLDASFTFSAPIWACRATRSMSDAKSSKVSRTACSRSARIIRKVAEVATRRSNVLEDLTRVSTSLLSSSVVGGEDATRAIAHASNRCLVRRTGRILDVPASTMVGISAPGSSSRSTRNGPS